ncbi:ABC transporter permease [Allomuricauda sp. SCSIO 65647]|uniref:ABC transporter permease n=1 Tax=Allomuricauda sp. SCSIO 65647 TaxID=2908843 RepID=UPI001F2B9488|nr:ABC transporter permease [Muricauda sp. SCSIO 65647]UJH69168.1 ABC transporter permease [Muricauda sp. SCSIO 65647]
MFKNYLKVTWRNLIKNRVYSIINIGGLAIGIAACLLILQYVMFEFSYEDFHEKKDRIYRVQQDRYDNGKLSTQWAAGAYAVGNSFKEAIPEIEEYVKVVRTGDIVVEVENRPLKIEQVFFATNSFFTVFSYPLLYGKTESLLTEPYTAAISESTALRIFGTTNVVDNILPISGGKTYRITGVFKDMPMNTQLRPDFLASYASFVEQVKTNSDGTSDPEQAWDWDGCLTYVLLQKGVNPIDVEAKFPPIVDEGVGELMRRFNASVTYYLKPLTEIHLYSNYLEEPGPNGNSKMAYLLLGVAIFIIVIAWVNYINLATARAMGRAREVGVRKSVGSQRKHLITQFFLESALFNGLAVMLALIVIVLVLPSFGRLSDQYVSYDLFSHAHFWLGLSFLYLVGVFLSGFYPALVLSKFRPVEVLKGNMSGATKGAGLRKGLVVFQFAASLFLLIGSLVIYQQIQFMRNQSLGIDISQTLVLPPPIVADSTFSNQKRAFKQSLLQHPLFQDVAVSSFVPGTGPGDNAGGIRLLSQDDTEQKQYRFIRVDHDFVDLFEAKIVAGRKFSEDFGAERTNVIFNRKGIEQLGFDDPEEAIGKQIEFWGDQCEIVGVIENFHQESLRDAYEPLILILNPDVYGYFSLKIQTDQIQRSLTLLQSEWDTFFPGNTFDYFFLDERFNAQYKADRRFGKVFGIFTTLAILVACLGLFGLASYTTLQRTKEIGIRKVLGASVVRILKLLYKEFAILLLLAFVIAIPLAWYVINNWLNGYAFRINIHWTYFAIPFFAIAIIALLTVSFQSVKSAMANPVKSLRTE